MAELRRAALGSTAATVVILSKIEADMPIEVLMKFFADFDPRPSFTLMRTSQESSPHEVESTFHGFVEFPHVESAAAIDAASIAGHIMLLSERGSETKLFNVRCEVVLKPFRKKRRGAVPDFLDAY